jgi:hypothetical protein
LIAAATIRLSLLAGVALAGQHGAKPPHVEGPPSASLNLSIAR